MIDTSILRILTKVAPNYHVLPEANAKASTVCVCSRCTKCVHLKGREWYCQSLLKRLEQDEQPKGYARVDKYGTCDIAVDPQLVFEFPLNTPEPDDPIFHAEDPNERGRYAF